MVNTLKKNRQTEKKVIKHCDGTMLAGWENQRGCKNAVFSAALKAGKGGRRGVGEGGQQEERYVKGWGKKEDKEEKKRRRKP